MRFIRTALRGRLTYANVMTTVLAFVVFTGGAAYAAGQLGWNSVGTRELKPRSVGAAQLKGGSVGPRQLAPNAVATGKVRDGSLYRGDLGGVLSTERRGPQGERGPAGPRGPSGDDAGLGAEPLHGYLKRGTTEPGFLEEEQWETVVDLAVPPGSYFVNSSVETRASGGSSAIECRLITVGGETSSSTKRTVTPTELHRVVFSLVSEFVVAAGQGIDLQCSYFGEAASVQISKADVAALQIGEITDQGGG